MLATGDLRAQIAAVSAATPPTRGVGSQRGEAPGLAAEPAGRRALTPIAWEWFRGKILLQVTINGRRVMAFLDNAANYSVMDRRLASELGLKEGAAGKIGAAVGAIDIRTLPPVSVEFTDGTRTDIRPIAADLAAASVLLGRPIEFVIGGDFFRKGAIGIDFPARKLLLMGTGVRPNPPYESIPLQQVGLDMALSLKAGAESVTVVLDLGSNGELELDEDSWKRAGADVTLLSEGRKAGAQGQIVAQKKAHLPAVTLGSATLSPVDVRIGPLPPHLVGKVDGMIGANLLSRYRIVLDVPARRLWLWRRSEAPAYPADRTGLGLTPAVRGFRVAYVATNSPAERAGWKAGDTVCAANDMQLDPASEAALDWVSRGAGETVRLRTCDGKSRSLTLENYY
ncbi:MAG: hypothetical protein DI605_07150 [Sphingomonas sp.]|nr:MAG: hypothetical protein DI605_07150 [Sphingomonas sp.]